eukprot:CAMPEP_0170563324 /NCGR_PEP_ID=MMETSP0211-20121228/65855_1 /TAXON_ID=311385 /ORGANISM="Pseudokeronopsis sp., Strain OXSARD2" /LENGTH=63 /DNA_ID=CAMNT_0010881423 /DNA_START=698 /DNA_END=886 /DNA_ORIENTATION=-
MNQLDNILSTLRKPPETEPDKSSQNQFSSFQKTQDETGDSKSRNIVMNLKFSQTLQKNASVSS